MMKTRFTELLGCDVPIQVSPMSGITTPDLAEAVIGAGGHAMLGVAGVAPSALGALLDEMDRRSLRTYGVNFLVPFLDPDALKIASQRARLIDFYLGDPDKSLVDAVHASGALASWQVSSVDEAVAAVEAGCDLITAHGIEAGGRNPAQVGLFPLLAQVLDTVDVPVVAAGGIGTARGVAAALAAGADCVRVGTRFVATRESGAHPRYVEALIAAPTASDTLITDAFSVMWPSGPAPHRVLRSALAAAEALEHEVAGEVQAGAERVPIPRFAVSPPTRAVDGAIEAMALYAGESVGAVKAVQPAAEIVRELMVGAEALLKKASQQF
jgi:NAD(P)H-dependent flavin oxidoreductase YrpB (nitropropane dioxygenase family)